MKTLEYTEDTQYSDGESVALHIQIVPVDVGDSDWSIVAYTDDNGYHEGEPERELIDSLWYVQRDVNRCVDEFKDTFRELEDDD